MLVERFGLRVCKAGIVLMVDMVVGDKILEGFVDAGLREWGVLGGDFEGVAEGLLGIVNAESGPARIDHRIEPEMWVLKIGELVVVQTRLREGLVMEARGQFQSRCLIPRYGLVTQL